MVIFLIDSYWKIVDWIFNFVGISGLLTHLTWIFSQAGSYVPLLRTYLGYVFFFIPASLLVPFILVSFALLWVRVILAIVHLVWW